MRKSRTRYRSKMRRRKRNRERSETPIRDDGTPVRPYLRRKFILNERKKKAAEEEAAEAMEAQEAQEGKPVDIYSWLSWWTHQE